MKTPDESYTGFGWIKVKRYEMDAKKSWEERYRELEAHHLEETGFLIAEVRRLAAELKGLKHVAER
jgi:hypothetical protein